MESSDADNSHTSHRICILGCGTIGLSFLALHLESHKHPVTVYDIRPDVLQYVESNIPNHTYMNKASWDRLHVGSDLFAAVRGATVVQECLPEKASLKQSVWQEVEKYAPKETLFMSSTSGIPASVQNSEMQDKTRLLVAHPYNPPSVMKLIECVPSPSTSDTVIERTFEFWRSIGRDPVLVRKEMTGFVANRLAFALFREAVHLVDCGVVGVEELDSIVQTSMGPRWAVAGPFKSYHAGGGPNGLKGFMNNIGGTVGDVWDDLGDPKADGDWREKICAEAQDAYGVVDTAERDHITRIILETIKREKDGP